MTRPRPAADSVRQRLRNYAGRRGEDFQRVLTRFVLERLLYRLSQSSHADQFVLKGAMLFALWSDVLEHRATKDLDLLGRGPPIPNRLADIFRDVCAVPVDPDDGVDFDPDRVSAHAIREEAIYDGIRILMEGRLGQARLRLQVDVGYGDAVAPPPALVRYPTLLDHPAPELAAYRPATVVAEKLQAMVALGIANSRMKDFFDIRWCARNLTFDRAELAQAIRSTFARRGESLPAAAPVALTPTFGTDPVKQVQWRAFVRKSRLVGEDLELPDVVSELALFLLPVLVAGGGGTSPGTWPAGGPWANVVGGEE